MSAICQCGQMGGVTHSCISSSYSGQTTPLYTKKILSQSGGTTNTHKEEYKLGDRVQTRLGEGRITDYKPKMWEQDPIRFVVELEDGSKEVFATDSLAPLEPKEECEHMLVSGPLKCIKCGDLVEPTPPSQIEEEPLRTLVEKWREYNSQQTNEGFDMPVDKSFRGFMEWLGDNTK